MEWRVLERPSLHLEMSLPEVEEATAEGASALSKRRQEALLTQVVEQAHANGKGCLGGEETMKALEERRVDTLLLSRAFVEANPDYADQAVTLAFEQDADVRVLGGAPSEKLDAQGGGIGARLRYRIRTAGE
jgi:peptide subunit release factor 1 (eRF1)